jgi:hypothetical protein
MISATRKRLTVHVKRDLDSWFRITAIELIRVRHHRERFSFTRVYRGC